MKIVVDLGCRDYGGRDNSIEPLLKRFEPTVLYGFDPNLKSEEVRFYERGTQRDPRTGAVILSRRAAWIHGGMAPFQRDELRSAVSKDGRERIPCFDFSMWLQALPMAAEVVVKMDIEGAEYPILAKMHADNTDWLPRLILVEWHTDHWANGHGRELPKLRCEIEEWH